MAFLGTRQQRSTGRQTVLCETPCSRVCRRSTGQDIACWSEIDTRVLLKVESTGHCRSSPGGPLLSLDASPLGRKRAQTRLLALSPVHLWSHQPLVYNLPVWVLGSGINLETLFQAACEKGYFALACLRSERSRIAPTVFLPPLRVRAFVRVLCP